MGMMKLIKDDCHCVVELKHVAIPDIMSDFAMLTGALIKSTPVSRETWLDWIRSEEFEDIVIDMADTKHEIREIRKGGDHHKKKSSCDRRRRSDFRRKI